MTGPVTTEALVASLREANERFAKAEIALQQVTAERDEADRRAGAAEREAERDREDARKRSAWLHQAKQQAGYSTNVSFDKVWAETLEKAARADAATSELARLRAEGEAKDKRIATLTEALKPFAEYARLSEEAGLNIGPARSASSSTVASVAASTLATLKPPAPHSPPARPRQGRGLPMAPEKSHAAKIEAVLMKHYEASLSARDGFKQIAPECAAEIAALQSRAFEDGARWMRERAAETAKHRYSPLNTERFIVNGETVRTRHGHDLFVTIEEADRHVGERVAAIQSLPLEPEGERNA